MEFHHLQLKWNMIQWNSKHCFWVWIFHEREFTDPSLFETCIVTKQLHILVGNPEWVAHGTEDWRTMIKTNKKFYNSLFYDMVGFQILFQDSSSK